MPDPRIAQKTPAACAGCFGQHPNRLHVDFATVFEGPVIDPDNPRRGRVDWLVLCEKCVRRADSLLPPDPKVAAHLENLERQATALTERAEKAEDYASRIEDTLQHRPPERGEKVAPTVRERTGTRKPRYASKA